MKKTLMSLGQQRRVSLFSRGWQVAALGSTLVLAACHSMPYKIVPNHPDVSPAPVCAYPSLTIGAIRGGNYEAPVGVTSAHPAFRVAVPQSVMKIDPHCWPIVEGENASFRYVVFGPTYQDKTIYRLRVGALSAHDHSFFNFSEKAVAQTVQKMVNHYNAPVTKLIERYYVYHGHSTRFVVYQQHLDGHGGAGAIAKEGETLTQIVYVIKQYHHYAVFWVTASSCSRENWVNGGNRMSVLRHHWVPMTVMLNSFSMSHHGGAGVYGASTHKTHGTTTAQPVSVQPTASHTTDVGMTAHHHPVAIQSTTMTNGHGHDTAPTVTTGTMTTTGHVDTKVVHLN